MICNDSNIAFNLFDKLNIKYENIHHRPITSVKNIDDIFLPGPQVKNLFLKTKKKKKYFLLLLFDQKQADLKKIAEELNVKSLSFASDDDLELYLKCIAGSITPLSLIFDEDNKVQLIIDSAIDKSDTLGVHPFVNDITTIISFHDFEKYLDYAKHEPLYLNL